jgi:hypothetical protein
MSKRFRCFSLPLLSLFAIATATPNTPHADQRSSTVPPIQVVIRFAPQEGGRVLANVGGLFRGSRRPGFEKSFSIPTQIAGVARQIYQIEFQNKDGKQLAYKVLAPGEYVTDELIYAWSYTVDISPPSDARTAAHRSWVSADKGILMMRDLWPRVSEENDHGIVNLKLPEGWTVSEEKISSIANDGIVPQPPPLGDGGDWYGATSDSVFFTGRGWRKMTVRQKPDIAIHLSGGWHFSDDEASQMVRAVYTGYEKLFGHLEYPVDSIRVGLANFPGKIATGEWQAETRGSTVTILSSDMPFRTQSLQRLHEQLRHELFHLWIPNNVNLTGNYDWFYEGFALYQSLKLAVAVNQIRFEDFLDTLSRAHTIDSAYTQRPSLIDASRTRFSGTNTQVYARGMLVAFLTDLALMEKSRSSVDDLLREIYQKHRKPAAPADGNDVVIGLMKANSALEPIVSQYVTGKEVITWKSELAAAGIEDNDPGPLTSLRVSEKLSGRQKTRLDKLGYNNWRKLSPNSR